MHPIVFWELAQLLGDPGMQACGVQYEGDYHSDIQRTQCVVFCTKKTTSTVLYEEDKLCAILRRLAVYSTKESRRPLVCCTKETISVLYEGDH